MVSEAELKKAERECAAIADRLTKKATIDETLEICHRLSSLFLEKASARAEHSRCCSECLGHFIPDRSKFTYHEFTERVQESVFGGNGLEDDECSEAVFLGTYQECPLCHRQTLIEKQFLRTSAV